MQSKVGIAAVALQVRRGPCRGGTPSRTHPEPDSPGARHSQWAAGMSRPPLAVVTQPGTVKEEVTGVLGAASRPRNAPERRDGRQLSATGPSGLRRSDNGRPPVPLLSVVNKWS
jgi:hypothetical protein